MQIFVTRQAFDFTLLFLATGVLVAAFIASAMSGDIFFTYFGAEDSLVENATAIVLGICGLALWWRALQAKPFVSRTVVALGVLYGLVYIWAGGEEISWGQRILGFESPEYFQENNDQQEFTFHNLVIGDVKLDELIFGPVLSYIILAYLIVLPLLWPRAAWVQALARKMIIPVPQLYHAAFALGVTLIIPFLDESRRWEVYECIFALLSLAIFLHPANHLPGRTDQRDPMSG
ncbi:MAG: hypothetical protein DCO97_04410 [Marivita sp. XM-24bin2]|jgi:hypothetical protein|nr:MAG: hypothetical protein DCO97_04410 [Marivita sp. XM-24bin2]